MRIDYYCKCTLFILLFLFYPLVVLSQNLDSLIHHSFQFGKQQLENTVLEINDVTRFPRSTKEDGSWITKDSDSWTSGFFPGCLWYMYWWSGNNYFKDKAMSWTASMEQEKYDTGTHDVGFKIFCSFGNGFRITNNSSYKEVILQAAQSLATRYNPIVGCIKSWDNPSRGQYPVIIDNMMNLELLLWAAKNGGEPQWYDIAISHSLKTLENHVRADGSTYHVVDFDPLTGDIISKKTVQGYSDESTWSRGQAWGLYGFTMVYRETEDIIFLEAAKKIANYFIDNLPEDNIPYWDFNAPNIPQEEKDASAAAIAASGLLELSTLVPDTEAKQAYRNASLAILNSLSSPVYLAEGTNSSGILLHGVGNHNSGSEVDVSLIYADYYFIEALSRYLQSPSTTLVYFTNKSITVSNSILLSQNYPNPFNNETTIQYTVLIPGEIWLGIYSLSGNLLSQLKHGYLNKGKYSITYNANNLASGTYFIVLKSRKEIQSTKMTLIK